MTTSTSRLRLLPIVLLLGLLPGCGTLWGHAIAPDGTIETHVLGIHVADQAPAPARGAEIAPWSAPEFLQFDAAAQLAIVEGWNAAHGGSVPPASIPWGTIIATVLGGGSGLNLISSIVSPRGRANWTVVRDGDASWWGTARAAFANLQPFPLASSPPEAHAVLAESRGQQIVPKAAT